MKNFAAKLSQSCMGSNTQPNHFYSLTEMFHAICLGDGKGAAAVATFLVTRGARCEMHEYLEFLLLFY